MRLPCLRHFEVTRIRDMKSHHRSSWRRNAEKLLFAGLCFVAVCAPVRAETLIIKLATVAPAGSTWHQYLQDLDAEWNRASEGRVRLKIYAGTLGDEDDIVRRLRIGQIDAATVSTAGLATIHEAGAALGIPLAFKSYDELDYVQEHMAPIMEEALRRKGIVVLNWGDAGWVHFFTSEPVRRPADLRQERLFVWDAVGAAEKERLWKKAGFHPVPLSTVDIIPALQTGMVTAYQAPPIAALASQWFPFTDSMTDLRWAPLIGATIITIRAWSHIPADLRPELRKLAEAAGDRLRESVRRLEQDAIAAMEERGLEVVEVSPENYDEWEEIARAVYPEIRGSVVPARYFDEVLRLRDEFRARHSHVEEGSD